MIRSTLLLIVCSLYLSGCLKTRAELRGEGADTAQQRQMVGAQKVARETPLKAPPASIKFDEYDEQLRNLNGRVDSLENFATQINAAKTGDSEGTTREKAALNQKLVAYEEAIKKLEAEVQALNEEVNRLKAPPAKSEAAPAKKDPRATYDDGEEHFAAKKWKDAILSYSKYRDANPKGKFYPDATYKMGVAFQELGMKDEARTFYEELKDKFPSSKEAKKAVARLKTLK